MKALKSIGNFLAYVALIPLSSSLVPLPTKVKNKFRRSAWKRWDRANAILLSLRGEDRDITSPIFKFAHVFSGNVYFKAKADTILIISHDSSRTGAPIVAYNLAKHYSSKYNVIIVVIRDGDIREYFVDAANLVIVQNRINLKQKAYAKIIEYISQKGKIKFALVNSIESRQWIEPLKISGIPTVALIHEFAAYTLPRSAFTEALRHADRVVFSTPITKLDALEQTGYSNSPKYCVLPQGKCLVPGENESSDQNKGELEKINSILRPTDQSQKTVVIIGAGTVQYRKGVDLFIQVAKKILKSEEASRFYFYWFGPGYAPDADVQYSVYIKDQIVRSGLSERIVLLPPTPKIEFVYELADFFLLTSRLDPFPNVAIDAILAGLPVLCFDSASGIPEVYAEESLKKKLVSDYLDTSDMADLLIKLAKNPELVQQVRQLLKNSILGKFDFKSYCDKLENVAERYIYSSESIDKNVNIIKSSKNLIKNYYHLDKLEEMSYSDVVRSYLNESANGIGQRRPEPGFNPHIYLASNFSACDEPSDAYTHFLQHGRPAGPWNSPVILGGHTDVSTVVRSRKKVALHIHAYYAKDLEEIILRLNGNNLKPHLYVNVSDEKSREIAEFQLNKYLGCVESLDVFPNRGRDVGAFITGYGAEIASRFEIIGHIHTKRSVVLNNRDVVERWKIFLLENMLGGQLGGQMVDRIISIFTASTKLGIVYPADPNLIYWGKNLRYAQSIATRMNIGEIPEYFDFPVGNMFWCRSAILKPFLDLKIDWDAYPREPVPYDGTMLHAIERLIGIVPSKLGYGTAVTYVPGVTR